MGFSDLIRNRFTLAGVGVALVLTAAGSLLGRQKLIESEIRAQDALIDIRRQQIEPLRRRAAETAPLAAQSEQIKQLKEGIQKNSVQSAGIASQLDELLVAINFAGKEAKRYRDAYRASERRAAEGERFEEIVTLSGKIFRKVQIHKVFPTQMRIISEKGPTTLLAAELPQAMQDRFQFSDEEEMPPATTPDCDFPNPDFKFSSVEIQQMTKQKEEKLDECKKIRELIEAIDAELVRAHKELPALHEAAGALKEKSAKPDDEREVHKQLLEIVKREQAVAELISAKKAERLDLRSKMTGLGREAEEIGSLINNQLRLEKGPRGHSRVTPLTDEK